MDLGEVRELVNRGRYATALREATEGAAPAHGAIRSEYLLLAARAAQQLGLHRETARLAGDAVAAAGNDPGLRARALTAVGAAAVELGDPGQAEQHLLAAAAFGPPADVAGAIQFNLGTVYEMMRRKDAAIAAYRSAARVYGDLGESMQVLRVGQNIAWLLLEHGDLAGARAEMDRTVPLLVPGSPEQAQHLALEAGAARLAGQGAEAVRVCEDLLVPGHPGATAWCRCYAAWLMGDVAADEGRFDLARQFLARARREAEGARDPGLWNRLTELQNRLGQG